MLKKDKKSGWDSAPDYTPQGNFWRGQLLIILLLAIGVVVALIAAHEAKAQTLKEPVV